MRLKIAILSLAVLVLAQAAPSPAPSPAPAAKVPVLATVPPKDDKAQAPPAPGKAAGIPVVPPSSTANKPVEPPKQQSQAAPVPTANKPAEVKPVENKKPEEPKKDDTKKPAEQPKQQPIDNKKPDEHKKDEPHKEPEIKKPEVPANSEPHKPDDHHKVEAQHQDGKRGKNSDEDDSESDEDDSESDEDNSDSDEDDDDEEMSTFELEQRLKHAIQLRYQSDIEHIMKFVFRLTDLKNQKEINQHLLEVSPGEATLKCMAPIFERMVSSVASCEHAADEHVRAIETIYRKEHPEEHKKREHHQEYNEERRRHRRSEHSEGKYQKDHLEYHREYNREHRPEYHEDNNRNSHRQDQHGERYYGEYDRSHQENRNHQEYGRPQYHGEQNHRFQETRRDMHGMPCRNHHEDEMRMAHEIFVGQCFINSLVATKDKVSNNSILDEAKMKQEISITLLAKANKDKAMVDLHNCLVAPRDVTPIVEMMSGAKHFTTRLISPMVSALYNNQQPSMSMIVQGQAKLADIKNNLYNLKGMICLIESLAKNGCGAVGPQH